MAPTNPRPPDPTATYAPGTAWPAEDDLERIRAGLLRAVTRVCPASLVSRRDDIVQAALIRVAEVLRKGEHTGIRSTSYLWQVAYTATVDEIRRATRRQEVSLQDVDIETGFAARSPNPEQEAAATELAAAIRGCLLRLIRPRRLAVTLHLLGFVGAEAGKVLGWDLKRVRNLTYRGLADLRGCLEAKGVRP